MAVILSTFFQFGNPRKMGFRGGVINGLKAEKRKNVVFCSKKGENVG